MNQIRKSLLALTATLALICSLLTTAPAQADVDIYITDGYHQVNGREWRTTCEPYSITRRCRTEIKATQISYANGRFTPKTDWVFNNLTYAPSPRSVWKGNPVGGNGVQGGKVAWTATDGRKWRTECDTALTGRNGCRSFVESRVVEVVKTNGNTGYRWVTKWILNNMVRFGTSAGTPTTPPTTPGQNTVEAGYAKGRVTNRLGQPIAGATVYASLADDRNRQGPTGRTDANGYYRIPVSTRGEVYVMGGFVEVTYFGKVYKERLHPDDSAFNGRTGAVRNLQWRTSGPVPGAGFYGGTMDLFQDLYDGNFVDPMLFTAKLVPVGPLLDGTTGQTITVRPTSSYVFEDIPKGRYALTLYANEPGKVQAVVPTRVRNSGQSYAASTTVIFPNEFHLMVEYKLG